VILRLYLFCVLLLCPLIAHTFGEKFHISQKDYETAKIFQQVEGKGILEITELLLDAEDVSQDVKEAILNSSRRIFLFEYPSDGLLIKGYLSFVSSCQDQPLVVFLRGGSELYSIKHPAHETSFIGNYSILSTTYRGGVSPGRDELGGFDVNDVKNLIDYIPNLEEALGISLREKEKYLVGWRRGGMQMFLALTRFPELQSYFDKYISLSGLLDLNHFLECHKGMEKLVENVFSMCVNPEWITFRNPIDHVEKLRSDLPLLIVQGTQDTIVPFEGGHNMVRALKEMGCFVDYLEIEGGSHCLQNFTESFEWIQQWLEN